MALKFCPNLELTEHDLWAEKSLNEVREYHHIHKLKNRMKVYAPKLKNGK